MHHVGDQEPYDDPDQDDLKRTDDNVEKPDARAFMEHGLAVPVGHRHLPVGMMIGTGTMSIERSPARHIAVHSYSLWSCTHCVMKRSSRAFSCDTASQAKPTRTAHQDRRADPEDTPGAPLSAGALGHHTAQLVGHVQPSPSPSICTVMICGRGAQSQSASRALEAMANAASRIIATAFSISHRSCLRQYSSWAAENRQWVSLKAYSSRN